MRHTFRGLDSPSGNIGRMWSPFVEIRRGIRNRVVQLNDAFTSTLSKASEPCSCAAVRIARTHYSAAFLFRRLHSRLKGRTASTNVDGMSEALPSFFSGSNETIFASTPMFFTTWPSSIAGTHNSDASGQVAFHRSRSAAVKLASPVERRIRNF